MHISKLYIKIFIAFLLVLLAAECVVFSMVLADKIPLPRIRRSLETAHLSAMLIENELRQEPPTPSGAGPGVLELMEILDKGLKGRVWLTDSSGTVVAASFTGPVPATAAPRDRIALDPGERVELYVLGKLFHREIYLQIPLSTDFGPPVTLHIYLGDRPHKEEKWFLQGLLLLTFLAAVFTIPVFRRITRPILKLSEASERLGHGDFSQRVEVRGKDEVAVLAHKFNRMAERLETMVASGKELTAHVSHELRSPLTRLRVSLQIIQERSGTEQPSENSELIAKMVSEIENMDMLIEQILRLSKLDMSEPPARNDSINMADLLQGILERYEPVIEKRQIVLQADVAPIRKIRCHRRSMVTLLDNVVGNALKYTDTGRKISIRLGESSRGGLLLRICNEHSPLSEKELATMFVPFQRIGAQEVPGTGLGLAFAQRMVELHDGTITASYENGQVCLKINLPFAP